MANKPTPSSGTENRAPTPADAPDLDAPPANPQELDALMEVLATVTARLQGMEGGEIRRHVVDIKHQVQGIVGAFESKVAEDEQRRIAAAEVEKLVDSVVASGTATGKALAAQQVQIKSAFHSVDLGVLADGLRVLADWLADPTDEGKTKVEKLVAQLEVTMGPMIGWDPEREDERRRTEIRAGVQKSLDDIFRPKKPPA
ncbi:MAG: hypothetical protein H0T79_06255 [Deltaproteobacteria bacterium]|nr:hypothetical protein [Deltaproteobacteria bacterium]